MQDLALTLVQTSLFWEDIDANLNNLTVKLKYKWQKGGLVVLPEMFATGFSMNPNKLAKTASEKSLEWMQQMASESGSAICGSSMAEDHKNYFNRFYFVHPDGKIETYDKRHLFSMGKENLHYRSGTQRKLIQYAGWKIFPSICYDLRFPVWLRNTNDYDLLLCVANWPQKRSTHWKLLLQARAIENLAYVAGVNRVGEDVNGIYHSGDSMLVEPNGNVLAEISDKEDVVSFIVSKNLILETREKLPFLLDRD